MSTRGKKITSKSKPKAPGKKPAAKRSRRGLAARLGPPRVKLAKGAKSHLQATAVAAAQMYTPEERARRIRRAVEHGRLPLGGKRSRVYELGHTLLHQIAYTAVESNTPSGKLWEQHRAAMEAAKISPRCLEDWLSDVRREYRNLDYREHAELSALIAEDLTPGAMSDRDLIRTIRRRMGVSAVLVTKPQFLATASDKEIGAVARWVDTLNRAEQRDADVALKNAQAELIKAKVNLLVQRATRDGAPAGGKGKGKPHVSIDARAVMKLMDMIMAGQEVSDDQARTILLGGGGEAAA